MNTNTNSFALILGASIVIASIIGSIAFVNARDTGNILSVTGSAKTSVKADLGKLTGQISRMTTIDTISLNQAKVSSDLNAVKTFFKKHGIEEKQLLISPVFTEQQYRYDNYNGPTQYNLRQTIELELKDVNKIAEIAKNITELTGNGVLFSIEPPQYYFSDLPTTRISLLEDAVKDAKARATKIAGSNKQKVGSLKSASVGVTQVTAPNSIQSISDYGTYDTSTIDKEVMITVKTTFNIK